MPTYIYECGRCGSTLERRQSFNDAPLTTHEECGGSLRRVLHPAPVIFKGSGFYNTDYRSSSNGASSSSVDGTSKSDSSESSKSDSSKDSGSSEKSASTTASD